MHVDVLDHSADPRLTPLIERWNALIEQFTGGDPGIRASLQKLYETEGPERASHGAANAETMEYAKRAMDAHAAGGKCSRHHAAQRSPSPANSASSSPYAVTIAMPPPCGGRTCGGLAWRITRPGP